MEVDVIAAVVVTALLAAGSPPAADVVTAVAGRLANSPVPVLSAIQTSHHSNDGNGTVTLQFCDEF